MNRPPAKAILALCCLAAALGLAPGGAAAKASKPGPQAGSLLYVQETDGGAIERVKAGVFRLHLRGVSARVSTFTDRPHRRAGNQGLRRFVRSWGENGFAADPPNAALVLHRAPRGRDIALLTLSHPRYDRGRATLTYRAIPLNGAGARALSAFSERADRVRAGRFGAASLFLDNGGGASYQQVNLSFSNFQPGTALQLNASATTSASVSWSLGPPGTRSPDLKLEAVGGASLPISQLLLDEGTLVVRLGMGEGGGEMPRSFTLALFLEAEQPLGDFYLRSSGGSGGEVSAQLGDGPSEPVGPSPTLFPWRSF